MELTDQIINLLRAAGFAAGHAWQAKRMPVVSAASASVWLKYMDLKEKQVVVTIFGPVQITAAGWEQAAKKAVGAVSGICTSYTVGPCSFNREMQYLAGDITCIFREKQEDTPAASGPYMPMRMGAQDLEHVTKFTAALLPDGTSWEFHLEEFFPTGDTEEVLPQQPFSLTRGKDAFHSCKVSVWERRWTPDGLLQIKEGTSTGRTIINA